MIKAYARASAVSIIFYCNILENKQSYRHLLCSVISHVVLFAYQVMLNISRQETELQKFFKNLSYIVNLSDLCNATKKILDKISFHEHFKDKVTRALTSKSWK